MTSGPWMSSSHQPNHVESNDKALCWFRILIGSIYTTAGEINLRLENSSGLVQGDQILQNEIIWVLDQIKVETFKHLKRCIIPTLSHQHAFQNAIQKIQPIQKIPPAVKDQ